ncbi:MAG: DUF1080 domain-containing protein, partial [Ginsengibacter sp.]
MIKNRFRSLLRQTSKLVSLAGLLMLTSALVSKANHRSETPKATTPLEGRWDITMDMDGKPAPSWLEVNHSGLTMLTGQFVGTGGSARPISRVYFADGKFNFSIPPQWEKEDNNLEVEGMLTGDNMTGTMKFPNGKIYNWVGKRAPSLKKTSEPQWGKPVVLFDGKNLDEWHTKGANQWKAENGMLRSPQTGSNLITNKKFDDFKLHIEFRIPAESNSGVYLRGRYEVQIEDSKGMEPLKDYFSSIYGFIEPSEMMAKSAGEWQTYDITLVGRM